MAPPPPTIAIIGAGLSGLSLGLALHSQNIQCTIFESRESPLNIGGAVMLSPNALKILDALGVYSRIRTKGFNFETLDYKNGAGELIETQEFGGKEKYGYPGLRIYRTVLIEELLGMLKERRVEIVFGKKFKGIVEESESEVRWEFEDGTKGSAGILVGADGIHSTVRGYLYPGLKPTFTGLAGITAAVPAEQLRLPADYHIPVTIMTPGGAFVIAPQKADGSEVLIGKQKRITETYDKAGWNSLSADKEALVKFLQQDAKLFPELVQNAVSNVPHDKINVWPFYVVPKLDRWASEKRRVIILGDSAHAIPPSAGQGINQAFEDGYIFALLLGKVGEVGLKDSLGFWQEYRQGRVDKVLALNKQIDIRRMLKEERDKLPAGSVQDFELDWLYKPDFKADVDAWVAAVSEK